MLSASTSIAANIRGFVRYAHLRHPTSAQRAVSKHSHRNGKRRGTSRLLSVSVRSDHLRSRSDCILLPAYSSIEQKKIYPGHNGGNTPGNGRRKTTARRGSSSQLSFQRIVADNVEHDRTRVVELLSKRLPTVLSEINLRNDKHTRSALEQHKNQYLPLKSLKFMEGFAGDPSVVLEAIDTIRNNGSLSGKGIIQLDLEEKEDGQLLVKRNPSFDYIRSMQNSRKKMMVVEVKPAVPLPRWATSFIRTLLCADVDNSGNSSVAYWRFDRSESALNIEFESEVDAMRAWINLERAMMKADLPAVSTRPRHRIEFDSLISNRGEKSYQLHIDEKFSLHLRPVEISMAERKSVPDISEKSDSALDVSSDVPDEKVPITLVSHLAMSREESRPCGLLGGPGDGVTQLTSTQIMERINELYRKQVSLPPSPREWLYERVHPKNKVSLRGRIEEGNTFEQQNLSQQQTLFNEVAIVVSHIKTFVVEGKIRALAGKDSHSLSDSLGKAMMIYSRSPSTFGYYASSKRKLDTANITVGDGTLVTVSPYEACLEVLDILASLNIDIHPSHFSCAIRAACHESRWKDAATLFLSQIDGNAYGNVSSPAAGGFVPIDPSLGWDQPLEIGLFAVARNSQLSMTKEMGGSSNSASRSTARDVYDTAMKMCMISPAGQESYILAAGSALGRAGLWRDCLELATDTTSIALYGPSMAAAAMLACIESSQYDEAVKAYNFFLSSNQGVASEWQWAGGNTAAVRPLCRDLALHAMGNIKVGGFSHHAMNTFGEIIEEDRPLSANALLGLTHSLENDKNMQSIRLLKVYTDSVYRKGNSEWRILPNALDHGIYGSNDLSLTWSEENRLLANILASVMRVCNEQGHSGLAIVLCSIVNDSYVSDRDKDDYDWIECKDNEAVNVILSQKIVVDHNQIMQIYSHSLHKIGCGYIADKLLSYSRNGKREYVSTTRRLRKSRSPFAESWTNAHIALNRVFKVLNEIQWDAPRKSHDTVFLFDRGLGRAMAHCIDAKQPAAALHFFEHAMTKASRRDPDFAQRTFAERVKMFFGVENADGKQSTKDVFQNDGVIDLKSHNFSDSVLAEVIRAYSEMGLSEKARSAFHDGMIDLDGSSQSGSDGVLSASIKSFLEALLRDNNIHECISFLDKIDEKSVDPSTYLAIARFYARNKVWPEVGVVYNRARDAGCISEDLALITMQAVCESELLDGKIVVLRNILKDVSALVGMKEKDWINSKYWGIKRCVGFHYARLLMRWNDPTTSQKQELLFAINEMRRCAREGITTKNPPLVCIAKIARVYGRDGELESTLSSKQQRSAVSLILEACVEANKSGLMKSYNFTAEVVRSLRALRANEECIKLVLAMVSAGKKCRHKVAMEEAMYAALEERDHGSLKLISEVYEKSGFDPKQMRL